MKTKRKLLLFVIALTLLCSVMAATILMSSAEEVKITGDMVEIENALSSKRLGDITYAADDGYIGIPYQVAVYHSGSGEVTNGIGGTPTIVYVVNTKVERVGTDSDVSIISSMLDRGYLVVVVDYLGNAKAVSPALDWSIQEVRADIASGKYFGGMGIPTSDYREVHVVPAGYDISLGNVYWEIDKHSSAGTLEYIVKVWNTDVRSIYANTVIKWTHSDGTRKATQNGYDGSEPVWLDKNGNASTNGQYIKLKHTLAEDIEDCVKPDGSPLDLNLYMNIIYPTNPVKDVPVMCLAGSGGHLAQVPQSKDRPHFNGYIFNGYAGVVYDHGYVPMARSDHYSEFSGSSANGVSGDNVTYSVSFYNDKKIHTAAMRFLRYLAASDSTYSFDSEAIGVYGNSKGGWMQFLGEEHPELFDEKRFFEGHHGESRYEAGETASSASGLIDGGTEQPWLTYNGVALDSGADLVYACCGGAEEHITDTHAPTFISCNSSDEYGTYYASSNHFVNACRSHNVPTMWVDVKVGHMFAFGPETNLGYDTYDALFDFCGYYLRGDAVKVVYTSFTKSNTDCDLANDIIVKFSGAVDATQMALVTVTDKSGNAVNGSWTSQFGNTEWTFTLDEPLAPATEYLITVGAAVKGDNGLAMGTDFVQSFTTKAENSTALSVVNGTNGTYYYYTLNAASEGADKYVLRFAVLNNANNLVKVYPVISFNAENPDSSTVAAQPVASCGIDGAGIYEVDVTSYVSTLTRGDTAVFLLKNAREAGESVVFSAPLDEWKQITGGTYSKGSISSEIEGTEGSGALKVDYFKLTSTSGSEKFYYYGNSSTILTASSVIKSGSLTDEDMGRTFTVSFRVYDTVSRRLEARLTAATSKTNAVADYYAERYNFTTVAGEWTEFSFDYTVYEPEMFGSAGRITKTLTIAAYTMGDLSESYPIYVDSIETVERVSTANLSATASLVFEEREIDPLETPYGRLDSLYEDVEKYPIAIFTKSGGEWAFKSATTTLPADYSYGADSVIYFRTDYALSSQNHNIDSVGAGRTLTIDLGGNTLDITGGGQYYSFSSGAKANNVTFNMINGKVYSNGKASLVCIYSNGSNTVNLNYKNLDITIGADFSEVSALVRHGYHPNAEFTATYNITFTDCDIDVSAANRDNLTVLRAGYDSSGGYVLNWKVNGGSLMTGTSTLYTTNLTTQKGGTLTLGKGSDGKYLKLIMTADLDNAMASKTYSFDDGKTRYFGAISTDGTNYVHEPMLLETPYGTISTAKLSALKYPFVAFVNGAAKSYGDFFANNPNMEYGIRSADGAVVLMRRDYAVGSGVYYVNICHHVGLITFDFGGYTLDTTAAKATGLFESNGMNGSFATHLKLTNGTILASNPLISIATYNKPESSGHGEGKVQSFTLENLNIISDGASLFNYPGPAIPNTANILIDGCSLDFSAANSISNIFMAGADNSGLMTTTLTVRDTELYLPSFNANFVTEYKNGSVIFDTSKGDFTLYVPTGSASPTGTYESTDGEKVLLKDGSDGEFDAYTLRSLETKYGILPPEYMSASEYPLLVYVKEDGKWKFHSALVRLPNYLTFGADAVILFRGDVSIDGDLYRLDSITEGTSLTFDLDGNTLNLTSGGQYWTFTTYFETNFTFTVKNGKVVNGGKANFISMSSRGSAEQTVIFDNLDISLIGEGTADGSLLTRYNSESTTDTSKLNFYVRSCDIDTSINSTTNLRIFNAGRYDKMFNVNYVVEGGTVTTASWNKNMFYSETGGKITFLPDAQGNYTVFNLPTGVIVTDNGTVDGTPITYYAADGSKLYFVEQANTATHDVYVPESLMTPYGEIAWKNSSRVDWPFIAFKLNDDGTYTYQARSANFFEDAKLEYNLRSNKVKNAIVLMRRDFTTAKTLNNLSNQVDGCNIILDFCGYTLTVGTSGGAINASAKHSTTGTFVFRNGTVLMDEGVFFKIDSADNGNGKQFNFIFDGLTFKFAEGTSVNRIFRFANTKGITYTHNLNFNDCIFDFTNAPSGATVFYTVPTENNLDLNVTVKGGRIIANSLDNLNIADVLSNVSFERNDKNNEYITIALPVSAAAPDAVINELPFVRLGTDGDYAVYYLRDVSKLVTPKGSLTLYSDFVYNVYVPKKDNVVSITVAGALCELGKLEVVTIDGVEYYHVKYNVSVDGACESFDLVLELQIFEGKAHTVTWTLDVVSYVKKLLDGNYSNTVKTLAKDILSYVRAAYGYAGADASYTDRIDAIIGADYDSTAKPNTSVDSVLDYDGLSAATLELSSAPAFRFYIDGSYDASLYKFTVGGTTPNCEILTDEEGKTYIKVYVYAYLMTETVCYTIDGTEIGGAYNLKSYYEFAIKEGDEKLITLVERLWKYSESANNYRNEALGNGGN